MVAVEHASDGADWRMYPESVRNYEDLSVDPEEARRHLSDPNGDIFIDEDVDDFKLRITDIGSDNKSSQIYYSSSTAKAALCLEPVDLRVRIISIGSAITIAPLQVTSDLMQFLLWQYQVHPDFLPVLFSFGQDPNLAEGCSGNYASHADEAGKETRISYQIRYVEENRRDNPTPWSFRHTGVYHHHTATRDIFILLHPSSDSLMERRLQNFIEKRLSTAENRVAFSDHAFLVHNLLMSSYLDNWRWYLRYLGTKFSAINDLALGQDPKKLNATKSFRWVQSLRNTNDFTIFAKACCSGNLDILESLQSVGGGAAEKFRGLKSHGLRLRGYVESADVLQGRIRNCIDLVGYTLSLHNQLEAAEINRQLRDLTFQTVDDSSTVKLITVFSAFFLPGSFVGTIYGMNFFRFDQDSYRISISHDFWIFIATWLPMTTLVGVLYFLFLRQGEKKKGKPFWPWNESSSQNREKGPSNIGQKPSA